MQANENDFSYSLIADEYLNSVVECVFDKTESAEAANQIRLLTITKPFSQCSIWCDLSRFRIKTSRFWFEFSSFRHDARNIRTDSSTFQIEAMRFQYMPTHNFDNPEGRHVFNDTPRNSKKLSCVKSCLINEIIPKWTVSNQNNDNHWRPWLPSPTNCRRVLQFLGHPRRIIPYQNFVTPLAKPYGVIGPSELPKTGVCSHFSIDTLIPRGRELGIENRPDENIPKFRFCPRATLSIHLKVININYTLCNSRY